MASSNSPTKLSSSSSSRPPTAVKFARRTSSGRVVSLSRDEDLDIPGEFSGSSDYIDYTVLMPPTPDNQPMGAGSASGPSPSGPGSRVGITRRVGDGNSNGGEAKMDRRMSVMKSSKSMLLRSQTGDFDHNRWLFETKGTYGIGNVVWTDPDDYGGPDGGVNVSDFIDKPWKPLTRKIHIPSSILSPYRFLVVLRLIALGLFCTWRVRNPNSDAMWLWGMSIACEMWFAFSWLLDQLPKLNPINRSTDLAALRDKFETPSPNNPHGRSDLPGVDVFVSTADPDKEPPLVTANTMLSILAVDYPVDKVSAYISDDGAAILTFEAMAEAVNFAHLWVPFCRKHNIEPRNPDSYFNIKRDPTKNKKRPDFVKDRRWIKREYDEFKVRINGLPDVIKKRCETYNKREQRKARQEARDHNGGEVPAEGAVDIQKATWMADGTHWPGTWFDPAPDHKKGDHAGIIQVMSKVPEPDPVYGHPDEKTLDFTGVDVRVPMFAYVSREKRKGYDHNKKAGAMNAMVRASAILSNGPFILNLDCDHYFYNSLALREGMCFMMDRGGDRICYIQFPQRFEGIDPSDRYANHNTVFFDGNMRALDGLQGPVYVGTGCLFRRFALYGFHPPRANEYSGMFGQHKSPAAQIQLQSEEEESDSQPLTAHPDLNLPKKFGNSTIFTDSIAVAEFQGRPLADHFSVKNGRPPGALLVPRPPLDAQTVAEAVAVISCWYEDNTEWGDRIGWIYGSVTEDVVTGYRMHNRGWRSVYCVTKRDAFRGTAPINLTDRLHQVLRWATGSVEIFFSRNNPILASPRLKFLQRVAYFNVGVYPFTSIFLVVYCFIPALSLFSGHFIVETLNVAFLLYLLAITITLCCLALLEVKWSGVSLEDWWRNEQFWVIGGSSAHLAAVLQGLLKVLAGIEISFTLTSKSTAEDEEDIYADLYVVKWTSLFIMPLTIIVVNLVAIFIASTRTLYSVLPQWNKLIGGVFFSAWVLCHMWPFCKGLMGRKGRMPTIIYVWSGLVAITVSLLWITISPPDDNSTNASTGGSATTTSS
ncbi:cellulose synthase-like protein D1 [Telopea speciosissima]|uniref:cellulose synthase-like protein D1 n=1 Tax=Telopea speciosissima TaxID=54955 RepID=UPI001CC7EACF|nr:cellulose synthase-like protein D1 [Telopea speciosissima]